MRARAPFSLVLLTSLFVAAAPALAQDPAAAKPAETAAPAKNAWEYPVTVETTSVRLALQEPTVVEHDPAAGTVLLRFPVSTTDALGRTSWGVIDISGRAHLDLASRLAAVDGLAMAKFTFPDLDAELATKAAEKFPESMPAELMIRLELLTDRPGAAAPGESPHGKVSSRPPELFVRNTPAVLVQIDGEPVLQQVESFPIEYVLNSASDLFKLAREDRWLLVVDGFWATATKLEGPWTWYDDKLPVVLTQLPIDHPRGHVRRYVPGTKRYTKRVGDNPPVRPEQIPEVIVTKQPSELVVLNGDPLFMLIPKVKLMTVANTASDLFFHPRTGKYFLLVSGRWFQADEVEGPWAEHYGALPDEFLQIPRDHGRAHVLWSVAGTPEAREAIVRATLPERALLHRRIQVGVRFEGDEADSSPIEGSEVRKVRNSEDDVFQIGGGHYACVRGAWFRSDDGKTGWKPIEELPESMSAIPESTGSFHVNFCRPLGAEDKGLRFSIQGPYRGVYVHKGVPVYGNGWDRNGTLRNANWYPMARTYGENRWYDPLAGSFRPRSVSYDETLTASASEWSRYTAGYGRVQYYADRYLQGGRRMFTYSPGKDEFDLTAPRPDVYTTWAEDLLQKDGLPIERFPLGDRSAETTPETPAVVGDETGHVYRMGEGGVELFVKDKWIKPPKLADDVVPRLEALDRVRSRTAQLRRWAVQRAAPLPVNPVVTPR